MLLLGLRLESELAWRCKIIDLPTSHASIESRAAEVTSEVMAGVTSELLSAPEITAPASGSISRTSAAMAAETAVIATAGMTAAEWLMLEVGVTS